MPGRSFETILAMKPLSIKNFIPGIAWFFVVLVLICLPSADIPEPGNWFDWMKLIRFDSIVHIGIFGLLSFLFIRPIGKSPLFSIVAKRNYFIKITLAVAIWGFTTELIQLFFVPSRSFEMVDWAADCIGVMVALIFSKILFLKKNKKPAQKV
jgi:hypothetical protein